MGDNRIMVEVFGGTSPAGGCSCSTGCGAGDCCEPAFSIEEAVRELEVILRETRGDSVEVKYIDTDKTGLKDYPLLARVLDMGFPFPIVAINGQPRLAGGIDPQQVEEILKGLNQH